MKAIVYTQYGSPDVLQYRDIEKPSPKPNEVLVKIRATALNSADSHVMRAEPFLARFAMGFFAPKHQILGSDIAGTVEAVGSAVKNFNVGDDVFGDVFSCGMGGFAEYVAVREDVLISKPQNISFEEAAASGMAATTALQALSESGQVKAGQSVLINGASGGVGTFAVQIVKLLGAEVTAVCSTKKVDLVRSLGADHVIDYTKENFTESGKTYDVILAANGYHPLSAYKRALKPNGIYIMVGGTEKQLFEALLLAPFVAMGSQKKMGNLMAVTQQHHLQTIRTWLETDKIKPVLDRCYSLAEMPQAMRYLEEGHAVGKIIIQQ